MEDRKKSDVRGRKSEIRGQKEIRGQRAERNQKSEVGSRRSEDRGKKVGGWRSASLEVGGKRKTIAD